jgi:predicted unusual protein kinase regulating ubiquinone biosynthesis (AarF/ABC1/UbiB family)
MRLLRRAASLLPQRAHYRQLLDEVESRLLEECDYRLEAEALAWFRERLAADVAVAEVIPSLSASLVLCTARLPGLHLDDWLLTHPGPAVRDLAAQRLYDAFVQSLHVLGRLHADPNPGNVLFDSHGRVGMLDFGCTRWVALDYQDLVKRIWRAAISGDEAAARSVYRDMGLFVHLPRQQALQLDRDLLRPFFAWLAVPLRSERFDFGRRQDFIAEGRTLFTRMLKNDALVGIRPEFMLVNRTLYGLYRLFERMRARVHCQTIWTTG